MTRIRRNTSTRHQRNISKAEYQTKATAYSHAAALYMCFNLLDIIL